MLSLASRTRSLATRAAPVCAPSRNLNPMFPHFATARELYDHIRDLSKADSKEFVVRNFVGVIEDVSIAASTVETELFPKPALEYYTKKNMGWSYSQEEADAWQLAERGGEQGDYRAGIDKKIANAIACLKNEPFSKRATITFPFSEIGSETNDWTNQGMNKCCRELHLYLEDGKLKCTAIVRMQNANVRPAVEREARSDFATHQHPARLIHRSLSKTFTSLPHCSITSQPSLMWR